LTELTHGTGLTWGTGLLEMIPRSNQNRTIAKILCCVWPKNT